jgi:hypothetical protein
MGNCYGEDSDSDDEYYGYYGKNNHRKPQPNHCPDRTKSVQCPPDPTPSEPDHHDKDGNDELEGLFESDEADEHGAREGKANGEHRHERPAPGKGEIGDPGKLERGTQGRQEVERELGRDEDDEANGRTHPDHHLSPTPTTTRDDHDPHAPTAHHLPPHHLPPHTSCPAPSNNQTPQTPTPVPYQRDASRANQQSHVTALNHAQRANTHDDDNAYSPTHILHPHDVPHSNQRGRTTTVKDVQHRTPSYPALHYPPAHTRSHTSHTNATELTPSPLINYLRPPPWPDPNVCNQNPDCPPTPSTTRFRPLLWPNDRYNTHPQSRPPPWPD